MDNYFFLDNWVYSLLTNPESERRLTQFVRDRGYTILLTSLSLIELYNPQWTTNIEKDRADRASSFLSRIPCVLINPRKVHDAEIAAHLSPIQTLPVELDLREIPDNLRAPTLLRFLRRDELFLQQGKDIEIWSDEYRQMKDGWLRDVDKIIEHAVSIGNLKRSAKGKYIELNEHKEQFLFSLDFRFADPKDIDIILAELVERAQEGQRTRLSAVRLSSLCFWYAYVEVDNANKIKRNGSDIGDFFHISLIPYCAAFTVDGSMYRMLRRIHEPIVPTTCEVITKRKLEEYLKNYP